jgi:hypothetical protein
MTATSRRGVPAALVQGRGGVLAALSWGLGAAVRRSGLVTVLWLVSLVFGGLFAALSGTALAVSLNDSWVSRSLLYDLDVTAVIALFVHAAPTLKLLAASAAALAVLYVIMWLVLHSAIVTAVCSPDDLTVTDALQAGTSVLPVFARLFLLAGAVTALSLGAVALLTRAVMAVARDGASEITWELAAAGGLVAGALVLVFCMAIHDQARIRAAGAGTGAWSSYLWAMQFVLAGGQRAYLLAVILQAVGLALWLVYQGVAALIDTNWMAGVVAALVWSELYMAARMVVRVWGFAAQASLQGPARVSFLTQVGVDA